MLVVVLRRDPVGEVLVHEASRRSHDARPGRSLAQRPVPSEPECLPGTAWRIAGGSVVARVTGGRSARAGGLGLTADQRAEDEC